MDLYKLQLKIVDVFYSKSYELLSSNDNSKNTYIRVRANYCSKLNSDINWFVSKEKLLEPKLINIEEEYSL